jgi:hypothetical protein
MSKAQRYKQQQKDAKAAAAAKAAKGPQITEPYKEKTLRERQAENKAALAKHQASMAKLKEFENKLHPKPAGEVQPEKEKSALDSMFYDGGNLNKDQGRTSHVSIEKASPATTVRSVSSNVSHEKDTAIKPAV